MFFETTDFTGATRVTRTIAKKVRGHFETKVKIIENNVQDEIRETVSKENPDILFSSFTSINPEVITVGKRHKKIVVVRQDYKLSDLSVEARERVFETYPNADFIIAQTPEMRQELLGYKALRKCRIRVIENPLDEENILEKAKAPNPFPDNGNFHFLWVGRREPIKDIQTLQEAFEIVHNSFPMTDLTLISNDVNPYRWMRNADCLVISSISEASPNVLKEALFLKTKVVSTDCSPIIRRLLSEKDIAKVRDVNHLAKIMMSTIPNKKMIQIKTQQI